MLGLCEMASVYVAVVALDEAVTVGREHEALGKVFGDALGLGWGRGRIRVVEEVPPDRRRCTLGQKTLGLTAVAIRGEDD